MQIQLFDIGVASLFDLIKFTKGFVDGLHFCNNAIP